MAAEAYTSVRTVFFNKFDKSPCDLYLRLSDDKYVKVLNQNDELTSTFIGKYVSKKIFEFYLTNEDFKTHQDSLFDFHSNAKEILVQGKKVQLPEHEGMNEMMKELGVDEKQTKQINNISTQIVTDLNTGSHEFSSIISKFTTSSKRFLYDHSYLTALISCLIASKNEWGSTPNKEKLCMASILHEIGDEEQLKLSLDENLERQDFKDGVSPFRFKRIRSWPKN
jgi:HD-GYP domain-containing protein (c-di-GMP phosphodiesterase class II)